MPLTIKIVSEHRDLLGDDYVREYHEEGCTIGRSLQNDWIMPDRNLFISGRHATIDYKGGMYYLADTSTNGVYMNGESQPVGKGNPRRLFDGDHIRMGDFEFEVRIDKGESLIMPLDPDEQAVNKDHFDQFVDEEAIKTGIPLLDEDEITGDDEFQKVLFGTGPETEADPEPEPEPESATDIAAPDNKAPGAEVTAEDLFLSFLEGLGISRVELHPSINRQELMMTAGFVLREFVESTIKMLASRANLKYTFRLDQTTVLPGRNNPMKFSDSTNDLIKQLLIGEEGEYLGARDAVREAGRDLLNHQNAFLDAMNSAFIEFADRFDPDELQAGFDRTLDSKFLKFLDKSKYWDLYCDLYPIITEKGNGRFPQMFGEEFVRAYERQIAEYHRFGREGVETPTEKSLAANDADDPGLLATQKIDGPVIKKPVNVDQPINEDSMTDQLSEKTAANNDQAIDRKKRKAAD